MTSPADETSKAGNEETCGTSPGERTFRTGSLIALLVGAGISAALIAYHSFSAVYEAARRIGWGLGLTIALYFSGTAFNSFAWRVLFRSGRPGLIKSLFIFRWIRDSLNYLLPSALLGGDIVGIRLLALRGTDVNTASAVGVVDKTLEAAGLFFFAVAGIIALFEQGGNYTVVHWALLGLAVISMMVITLLMAQRLGLLKVLDKTVLKFTGKCSRIPGSRTAGIHDIAWAIYADRRRVTISTFIHMLAWVSGVFPVWVALHFMGHEIGWQGAFIIESLCQVACAAAFVMPAFLGAQEAAYMTIGMYLGVPPEVGLALSLVQRLKDILAGIPALLVWQGFEGSRLWTLWRKKSKR